MKASKMLISTLKEAPNEAIIDSHILLLRAGMVRKLVSGVYNYMPMGKRVLNKIQEVVRKHMDEAGALEILSSAIQPRELWEESGRWYKYGPELMRFKDRHERDFCLGPTHEEIFTDIVKNEVKSYKNLPLNIYQIQTKYRDEMRPRFGLIRSREFLMKDAYSFDIDEAGLEKSYELMKETYEFFKSQQGQSFKNKVQQLQGNARKIRNAQEQRTYKPRVRDDLTIEGMTSSEHNAFEEMMREFKETKVTIQNGKLRK